jgi:hypothetical protein
LKQASTRRLPKRPATKQADEPWKGPTEKEQKPGDAKPNLERWQEPTRMRAKQSQSTSRSATTRAQGRGEETLSAQDETRWHIGVDQAEQDLWRVHGGEEASQKEDCGEEI